VITRYAFIVQEDAELDVRVFVFLPRYSGELFGFCFFLAGGVVGEGELDPVARFVLGLALRGLLGLNFVLFAMISSSDTLSRSSDKIRSSSSLYVNSFARLISCSNLWWEQWAKNNSLSAMK
jgi:hypothetical protein